MRSPQTAVFLARNHVVGRAGTGGKLRRFQCSTMLLEVWNRQETEVITESRTKNSSGCLVISAAVLLLALYPALDDRWQDIIWGVAKALLLLGGFCAVVAAACAAVVFLLRAAVSLCGVSLSPLTLRVLKSQMLVVLMTWLTVWSAVLILLQQYGIIEDPGYNRIPTASIVIAGIGAAMLGACLSRRPFFHWIDASALPDRWRSGLHVLTISAFIFTGAIFAIMSVSDLQG